MNPPLTPITCTASDEALVELRADTAGTITADAVDTERRTITGPILTFGELGTPSTGPTVFAAGSISSPEDLSRVKLLVQHDSYSAAVGYLTALEEDGDQLIGTFKLPESDEGDAVLIEAADGRRDGLSVGVTITDYEWTGEQANVMSVRAAQLREVSVVTIPAYQTARITNVTASHQGESPMPTPQIDYAQLAAALGPQLAQIVPPAQPSNVLGLHANASLDAIAGAAADAYKRGINPIELAAALSDLLPADDAGAGIIRPQWIDEVWQASRSGRPFFDGAASKKNITGLKVQGWKYALTDRPKVDPYEGNKTAIASRGKLQTIPVEADVVRRAGGWDIDRALIDLGSRDFISALLTAATDDYKLETEEWLVSQLLAEATEVAAGATFAGTLAGLGVAAVQLGANLSTIQMSTDMWLDFAELTDDTIPWWLKNQGELNLGTTSGTAGKLQFSANPDLPAGVILAADSRAYTPFERDSLISVQAVNIANGGIDVGVFGYVSAIVNDPRAVLQVGYTAPVEGE